MLAITIRLFAFIAAIVLASVLAPYALPALVEHPAECIGGALVLGVLACNDRRIKVLTRREIRRLRFGSLENLE